MGDRCWGGLPTLVDGHPTTVRCDEPTVPMTRYCAEHLIAHADPQAPVAAGFPPTVATGPTK